MQNGYFTRFFLFGLVSMQAAIVFAQSSRFIEVNVVNEQDEPLVDATVVVRPAWNTSVSEESTFKSIGQSRPAPQVKTDATGFARIDVTELVGDDFDALLGVTASKIGYGPQSALVHTKAELKVWGTRKRTVQIVDAGGEPQKGLRVEHALAEGVEDDGAMTGWWPEDELVTNDLGLVTVDAPASGSLSLSATEVDGTNHRFFLSAGNRLNGRSVDFRDVSVLRLSTHGKVEGSMPAEFAKDFQVRLLRNYRSSMGRTSENWSSFSGDAEVDQEGRFRFDNVVEGLHWIVVYRSLPYENSTPAPSRLPVAVQSVDVVAGKTAVIKVGVEPLVKVTGRIVGDESSDANYAGLRLVFAYANQSAQERHVSYHPVARSICSADGTFTCWLPTGRFQLTPVSTAKWKLVKQLEFEIGPGAATISTQDLEVSPTKEFRVKWVLDGKRPNTLLSHLDNRVTFVTGEGSRAECTMSLDGYGRVRLPVGEELKSITRDIFMGGRSTEPSTFIDRDPSDDFELELVKTAQGLSSNVALRGRVVDAKGQGLPGVPVSVSLTYEPLNDTTTVSREGGGQLLDVAWSGADGNYQIPARTLFRRLTVPGREAASEGKFTFSVSTLANPTPIETEKTFTTKPAEWDMLEIELPDLVVDRPLGGNRLTGKVLDENGLPAIGERIRIADKGRIVRTFTDHDGQFSVEDLAGPVWLLRESDWSIHPIDDYSAPKTIAFQSAAAAKEKLPDSQVWQRVDRNQRLALAKELLKKINGGQGFARMTQNIPDEFYLEPEKYRRQLTLLKGQRADESRMQFVNFWTTLDDAQMQELAACMENDYYRIRLLRILADRHPSVAAYEDVMDKIRVPVVRDESGTYAGRMIENLAAVGLKLHYYGSLEPHRNKIRQFLELQAAEAAALANNPRNGLGAMPRMLEAESLTLCRALLDPQQFATEVLDAATIDSAELTPETRVQESKKLEILLRLFPADFERISLIRGFTSEQVVGDFGEQSPLDALAAVKQGKFPLDAVRAISASALASGKPEAVQVFDESAKLLLRADLNRFPMSLSLVRYSELSWYQAARKSSTKFGSIAAWHLANDYLGGRYSDVTVSILPVRDRYSPQLLSIAYCLTDEFPALSKQIVQQTVPRFLRGIEQEFSQSYSRRSDVSVAAWLDPNAATDMVIKLSDQLNAQLKNQPAGRPDGRLMSKSVTIVAIRDSCLRGLLLDEL